MAGYGNRGKVKARLYHDSHNPWKPAQSNCPGGLVIHYRVQSVHLGEIINLSGDATMRTDEQLFKSESALTSCSLRKYKNPWKNVRRFGVRKITGSDSSKF